MKFVGSQLALYLTDKEFRRNAKSLVRYLAFLLIVIIVYAILFQVIMRNVEGQEHSVVTGFYWTLTVMSTLGFGDITFESDIGRIFSMLVLLSGIVLLLIVLPFAFIRYFYAPYLESRLRMRAPREVPEGTKGHVILCAYDSIAPGLIQRMQAEGLPYYILEPDQELASERHLNGLPVVCGELESENTYTRLRAGKARMVLVNRKDELNTSIILAVRHVAPEVPVVAVAGEDDSVDVLELSGATHVLPLRRWLGEQLANRVSALHAKSIPIGQYEDLLITELPVHRTQLNGKTIRETAMRQVAGASIIGVFERGRLVPAHPDLKLNMSSVLVVIGTERQLKAVDALFDTHEESTEPVVVVGAGKVGAAVAKSLEARDIPVHLVERSSKLGKRLKKDGWKMFIGDASDFDLLRKAGILKAPAVVLTTNDDTMNIHLTSYCRQLNPDLRIVSRITQERNIEVIHRAGADFVLSYSSLGAEAVFSILKGQTLSVLGERVNMYTVPIPEVLHGKTLAESEIGARTGLIVIATQQNGEVSTRITASTELLPEMELLILGNAEQREGFERIYS